MIGIYNRLRRRTAPGLWRHALGTARLGAALLAAACADGTGTGGPTDADNPALALSGGAMTVFDATSLAFRQPAPNLSQERLQRHLDGDVQFGAIFVAPPAPVNAGLGPIFDNTSCRGCHVNNGRGQPPDPGQPFTSLLFRASVAGTDTSGGPAPAPGLGVQLQLRAVNGFTPDATAAVQYDELNGRFADGTPYTLRRPHFALTGVDAPLPGGLLLSPRVAPPVFGLGLLAAVDDATILAAADPDDRNHDGVSGRPNYAWNPVTGRTELGRFGWKANVASLRQQTAAAYDGDMGITSSIFPAEPCEGYRTGCERHAPEVSDSILQLAEDYVRTLGVPARRDLTDWLARHGEQVFQNVGCATCHLPMLRTGTVAEAPEASNQEIHPYTDLLLHDMGAGLADDRPDFLATGREWRTPPLWGIGLTAAISGHTYFLHDGRARSLLEAILWHGGEAAGARDKVLALPRQEREALLAFLRSL